MANGHEWRKFQVVPCSYSCVPLFSTLFHKGGNKRGLRPPEEGEDYLHCTLEPLPGLILWFCVSGREKKHKDYLFESGGLCGWGGGLQRKGVGLEKVHSLHRNPWKTNIFAGISPGASPGYPRPLGALKKVYAKGSLCSFCCTGGAGKGAGFSNLCVFLAPPWKIPENAGHTPENRE